MKMKTGRKTIVASLTLLLLIGISAVVQAETWESFKKKEVNKNFPINKNSLLFVDNAFGNITIIHWNKPEASIRVEVEAVASREQRAQQNLDNVKIDLRKEGDKVSAITSFANSKGNQNNERLKVNYYITIPATMKLQLSQRYGSIVLPSKNEGDSRIAVKFGNIHAGDFTKDLNLDAKYSNVNIRDVINASFDLGFCGDVEVGNGKKITINSKYSTLKIGDADLLNLENKFGNLSTKMVKRVDVEMKYGDVAIEHLLEEAFVGALDFSTLKIEELDVDFKRIEAESSYGTLDIRISPKASFRIDAIKIGENLDISGLKETKHTVENKTDHHIEINGGGNRTISFDGNRFSNLKIRSK